MTTLKRVRDDFEESESKFPDAKRIRDDLLNILDDTELNAEIQDLDSVMKSFAEEISAAAAPVTGENQPVSGSGDSGDSNGSSHVELGYLLEASDDELGLPPAVSEEEKKENEGMLGVTSDVAVGGVGLDEIWGFDDIPSYDEFGIGEGGGNGELLALDGLFDYSDVFCGGQMAEFSDFSWRHESLPAL